MTAPLTPALALAYLHELSLDVLAAVVLDASGAPLAGEADLAPRARALLAAADGPRAAAGQLLAAEGPNGLAIAVVAGPNALRGLLEHDLATIAQVLTAAAAAEG
jgi:hypothetical protein